MRKHILILAMILLIFSFVSIIMAQDSQSDLEKKIQEYQAKLNDIRSEKNTLSQQIQYMDTQIYLTGLRIQESQKKIETTQKEIELLSGKIDNLDSSLNHLSQVLLERVVDGYKKGNVSFIELLLASTDATDLLNQIKYEKTAQNNNQKLLINVQTTKLNFEEQKKLREDKKVQLAALTETLNQQSAALESQKTSKEQLLSATQNSEVIYQNLLDNAERELAGFSSFVKAAGGGLTTFGNGSNGWYYTQRDPSWGNMILPGSSSSVLLAGCAVSSVAMVCKSYGQGVNPASIASNPGNFINGDLWNWAFNCSGKSSNNFAYPSQDSVKSYVQQNTPVILRLISPSVSGLHFIVAWKWDDGKNDFIIHDPYYGPDLAFSLRYNWSQVTNAIVIK